MKACVFFIFYFFAASLLAALFCYPLYLLFTEQTFLFERWVSRFALLFLILGLIPCIKYFKLSLKSLGHNASTYLYIKQVSIGFAVGLVILGLLISSLLVLDIRLINPSATLSSTLLIKSLIAGLIIALIEETLFRGLFFKLTLKWHNALTAVVVSSFFYAILHFIKPIDHIDQNTLTIYSGAEVLLNAFIGLMSMQISDFAALFAVGTLLALVRFKTNSLTFCIGLHASWVFLIKSSKQLTDSNPHSDWSFLTGHYDGIVGWLAFAWLMLLSLVYLMYINNSSNNPQPKR